MECFNRGGFFFCVLHTIRIVGIHTLRLQHSDGEVQGVAAGIENRLLGTAEAGNSV